MGNIHGTERNSSIKLHDVIKTTILTVSECINYNTARRNTILG